jgi:hypothetical protein
MTEKNDKQFAELAAILEAELGELVDPWTVQYATREAWLHRCIDVFWKPRLRDVVLKDGTRVGDMFPDSLHISVGFSGGARSEKYTRGCCWPKDASEDKVNHVFLSPIVGDPCQAILTAGHEFIHAILDCNDGHTGRFKEIAEAVGFDQDMRSSHASEALAIEIIALSVELGKFPHGRLLVGMPVEAPVGVAGGVATLPRYKRVISSAGVSQEGRRLKIGCPICPDVHFRGTKSAIARVFPVCGDCGSDFVIL